MSSSPARARRKQLQSVLGSHPYNRLLQGRTALIKTLDNRKFYMIWAGEGKIGPDSDPTGVTFTDGSFLKLIEKWRTRDDALLEYSYHYQIPQGHSVRFELDSENASSSHPEYHVHTSALGDEYRLPTGPITGEEILQMIFEQFVGPKMQRTN
jgi:Family of unknown function (DUF6516)